MRMRRVEEFVSSNFDGTEWIRLWAMGPRPEKKRKKTPVCGLLLKPMVF